MSHHVPTVLVKGSDGNSLVINQSDYEENPDAWELWADEDAPSASTAAVAETSTTDTTMLVQKKGRKFYVVDPTGTVLINAEGYATEADAWGAIATAKLA